LILFPRKLSKPKKGDSTAEEIKLAAQLRGAILPVKVVAIKEKARVITAEDKKFEPYRTIRRVRADMRQKGVREKKAREAAEEGGVGSSRT